MQTTQEPDLERNVIWLIYTFWKTRKQVKKLTILPTKVGKPVLLLQGLAPSSALQSEIY